MTERHRRSWLRAKNNPETYRAEARGAQEALACARGLLDA